jgi:hypothetical protein
MSDALRPARWPIAWPIAVSCLLALGPCGSAQAGLADWFHGRTGRSTHTGRTVHPNVAQRLVHPVGAAHQTKIKPLVAGTRTAARTLVLKPRARH